MSINVEQAHLLIKQSAIVMSAEGACLGTVDQIYLDDQSQLPRWVSVATAAGSRFVPMRDCEMAGNSVLVTYSAQVVDSAPVVDDDAGMTRDEETSLLRHYADARRGDDLGRQTASDQREPGVVLRSEERLGIEMEVHATHRLRLRKHVVTENVTYTVPVRKEELRVERELIVESSAHPSTRDRAVAEDVFEIVLHEERVVITTQVVPIERVRVRKHLVTGSATVRADLLEERIEVSQTPGSQDPRPVPEGDTTALTP